MSSDGRSVTVDIQSTDSGGIATGRHTVNIQSNSIAGYIVTVEGSGGSTALSPVDFGGSTTTNNHLINPVSGTLASPSTLSSNTWGMAIPGRSGYSAESVYTTGLPAANGGTNGGVENAANQATLRAATFGQIPAKTNAATVIESNQASGPAHDGSATDTQNIYYGVNTEPTLQAGEYSTTITYTATVKLPAAPTNLSVSPNSYKLGSGDANTVTISASSGLASAYKVWIDLNDNKANTPDSGEECTNLNVISDTQLTCNLPTDDSITVDTPYTIYVQTQAASPATIPNSFTYTKPTGITTVTDGTVAVDLDDGMIPVIYNKSTSNWESLTTDEAKTPGTWYSYTEEKKQWANAVTVKNPESYKNQHKTVANDDILGYWVYIPRYAYKVMRYSVNDKYVSDSTAISNGGFEIVFETKDTPKKIPAACSNSNSNQYYQDCSNVSQEYGATTGTSWATHPAFTWGTEELNGFWIGKFETTGSTNQPTVLPNQIYISMYQRGNIGDYYDIAKSMGVEDPNNKYGNTASTNQSNQNNNNLAISTSHMLKNSEWGAVTYLASSKYGAGINNVQINSQYQSGTDGNGSTSYGVTGCGPSASGNTSTYTGTGTLGTNTACNSSDTSRAYNGSKGVLASTTNNVYGVYDMAGGAWEYVMGSYTTDASQSHPGNSYITNKVKPPYVDLYINPPFNGTHYTNDNLCTWATCGGHALYETKNVQSVSDRAQSWGGDGSRFVTSGYPWFRRGGSAGDGPYAGLFLSYNYSGYTVNYNGFRVALLPLPQG